MTDAFSIFAAFITGATCEANAGRTPEVSLSGKTKMQCRPSGSSGVTVRRPCRPSDPTGSTASRVACDAIELSNLKLFGRLTGRRAWSGNLSPVPVSPSSYMARVRVAYALNAGYPREGK